VQFTSEKRNLRRRKYFRDAHILRRRVSTLRRRGICKTGLLFICAHGTTIRPEIGQPNRPIKVLQRHAKSSVRRKSCGNCVFPKPLYINGVFLHEIDPGGGKTRATEPVASPDLHRRSDVPGMETSDRGHGYNPFRGKSINCRPITRSGRQDYSSKSVRRSCDDPHQHVLFRTFSFA
jgi:hypothetical protein